MDLNSPLIIIFLILFFGSMVTKFILDFLNNRHRRRNSSVVPPVLAGLVDTDKLAQMNAYNNANSRLGLIGYTVSKILIIVLLFTQSFSSYYIFLSNNIHSQYIAALVFFASYAALDYILGIPFDLYSTFVIEKKFGFNKSTIGLWLGDQVKSILVGAILGLLLLLPLMFFVDRFPQIWWLFVFAFFIAFTLLMQVIYPLFIAPLFNKFKPLDNPELQASINTLLEKTGFKASGVFEMDASKRSTHSNAYFTGLGKSKRIVLFDSFIKENSTEEIVSVLAHELGHFKKKHLMRRFISSSIVTLVGLYLASLLLNSEILYNSFYLTTHYKFIGLFFISIVAGPLTYFFSPLSAQISRKQEYEADAFAKLMSGTSEHLISSLKKLTVSNLSNIYPHPVYEAFYYSHPSLAKRIQALSE